MRTTCAAACFQWCTGSGAACLQDPHHSKLVTEGVGSLAQLEPEVRHEAHCSGYLKRGDIERLMLALLLKFRGIKAPTASQLEHGAPPASSSRASGQELPGQEMKTRDQAPVHQLAEGLEGLRWRDCLALAISTTRSRWQGKAPAGPL